jgi:hypothetical protein
METDDHPVRQPAYRRPLGLWKPRAIPGVSYLGRIGVFIPVTTLRFKIERFRAKAAEAEDFARQATDETSR